MKAMLGQVLEPRCIAGQHRCQSTLAWTCAKRTTRPVALVVLDQDSGSEETGENEVIRPILHPRDLVLRKSQFEGLGEACVGLSATTFGSGSGRHRVRGGKRQGSLGRSSVSVDLMVVFGALGGVQDIPQPCDVRHLQPLPAKFVGLGVLHPSSLQLNEELSKHVGVRILERKRIPLCPPAVSPCPAGTPCEALNSSSRNGTADELAAQALASDNVLDTALVRLDAIDRGPDVCHERDRVIKRSASRW